MKTMNSKYYYLDGQNWVMRDIIYVCPFCGNTKREPILSQYMPNTTCRHGYVWYQMKQVMITGGPIPEENIEGKES